MTRVGALDCKNTLQRIPLVSLVQPGPCLLPALSVMKVVLKAARRLEIHFYYLSLLLCIVAIENSRF